MAVRRHREPRARVVFRRNHYVMVGVVLATLAAGAAAAVLAPDAVRQSQWFMWVLGVGLVLGIGLPLRAMRREPSPLRTDVDSQARCARCRYELDPDHPGGVCPECGADLTRDGAVAPGRPVSARWVGWAALALAIALIILFNGSWLWE